MKNYQYIEELLERYFDAKTSQEEEALLRTFFKQKDIPLHLQHYAPLFVYQNQAAYVAPLGEAFDQRMMHRLAKQGLLPQRRVGIQRMTLGQRLVPLWRSAAAVAIFALLGGAVQEALRKTQPELQQAAVRELQMKLQQEQSLLRTQQMAIGGDSLNKISPENK